MGKVSAKIFDLDGKVTGKLRLPIIFKTPVRPDIIKRAVISIQSHRFQPQGRDVFAGKRTTAESLGVGRGIARIPRLKGRTQRGALAPFTVGGRPTHPPVAWKRIVKKIPRKEMRLALRSAVAATASKDRVSLRGHIVDDIPDFPLVVLDEIQDLEKTQEMEKTLIKLGLWPDVYRAKESRKIRAGKGKRRGRKMKRAVGPLLVITEARGRAGAVRAARNIPGVDIVAVNNLNVELLAPGTHPGRLTVWTSSAIEKLDALFGGE